MTKSIQPTSTSLVILSVRESGWAGLFYPSQICAGYPKFSSSLSPAMKCDFPRDESEANWPTVPLFSFFGYVLKMGVKFVFLQLPKALFSLHDI